MVSYLISTAASTIFMLIKKTGVTVQLERHGAAEAKKGIALKLRKQIGF